jgi:hypothetical protein
MVRGIPLRGSSSSCPTSTMSNDDYLHTQQTLATLAMIARGLELDTSIQQARQAEAVGPVLDPTAYQRGGTKLRQVIELAEAVKVVKKVADRHLGVAA